MADFLTIKEKYFNFEDLVLTFIGDGNNVANSLILCGSLLGIEVRIACPKGYEPSTSIINKAMQMNNKNLLKITNDPIKAASGANILYTDVWSQWEKKMKKIKKIKILKVSL